MLKAWMFAYNRVDALFDVVLIFSPICSMGMVYLPVHFEPPNFNLANFIGP